MTAQHGAARPQSFGPIQLARYLGWAQFQVERGVRVGLLPGPDLPGGRWSAEPVARLEDLAGEVRGRVGELPDVGASRVASYLGERFGCEVTVDAVVELCLRGELPIVDWYKDHPLYDGREVERFADRANRGELDEAMVAGRTVLAAGAAAHLGIRRSDFEHLVRAGLVSARRWVRSAWQRRRDEPEVALYLVRELDALERSTQADGSIDWAAVRATPKGRPSLLANLPTATDDQDEHQEVK